MIIHDLEKQIQLSSKDQETLLKQVKEKESSFKKLNKQIKLQQEQITDKKEEI